MSLIQQSHLDFTNVILKDWGEEATIKHKLSETFNPDTGAYDVVEVEETAIVRISPLKQFDINESLVVVPEAHSKVYLDNTTINHVPVKGDIINDNTVLATRTIYGMTICYIGDIE